MMRSPLPPEIREVIARAGVFPRGLAFLDRGDVECAAILFHTCPAVIMQVRRMLASPAERQVVLEAARRTQRRFHDEHTARTAHSRSERKAPRPLRNARELIRAAQSHSMGFSLLLEAPLETVAVIFQVHPDLVLKARAIIARCQRLQASRSRAQSPLARSH